MSSRTINVLLTGNGMSLRSTLVAAGRDVTAFQGQVNGLNATSKANQAASMGAASGATAMGRAMLGAKVGVLAVGAAFAYSTGKAIQLDTRMRNVNSLAHMSEKQLASMSKSVVNMTTRLPQTANDLAEALYEITSSGFKGQDSLRILEQSAIGASAGLSDTQTAAKGIVAVINAYGLSVDDAAHINNVLFTAVDKGIMSFGELSSNIGDFVGMASASKVPIEDAAAALAAMTLSGINANESATSLNRLMQSIIKTSAPLGKVFADWGFSSGEAALETLGLQGVMDRLRKTTGGSVTQLMRLFPEIRAVRGAFALMANDGENYNRTMEAMKHADEGQGAAKKALKEQLKSVSAQWQLFVNWVNAGAITLGSKMLPVLLDLISGLKSMFQGIGNFISGNGGRLNSFFGDMGDAFKDLTSAAGDVYHAIEPTLKLLLGIAGGTVIMTLKGIAAVFKLVASIAHRLSGALAILFTTLALFKGAQLAVSGFHALGGAMETAALKAMYAADAFTAAKTAAMAEGAGRAASNWAGLSAVLGGVSGTMVGMFAVVAAGVGVWQAMNNEASKAKEWAKDFEKGLDVDPNDMYDAADAAAAYTAQIKKLKEEAGTNHGFNALHELSQLVNPWASNDITQARARLEQLDDKQVLAARSAELLKTNTTALSKTLGVNEHKVKALANRYKVNLEQIDLNAGGLQKWTEAEERWLKKRAKNMGTSSKELKAYSTMSVKEMEAAMKAEMKFQDQVAQGMAKTQSIVAKFGKEGTGPAHLKNFFNDQLKIANDFTGNIAKAIQMGLDPNVLKEMLLAGPAEAAGLLEDIVSDSSGNMLKIVNNGVAALEASNARLLELSRIAYRASTAQTQQMAKDASLASKVSMITMDPKATTNAGELAKQLGVKVEDIKRVADEYGIVVDMFNGQSIDPEISPEGAAAFKKSQDDIKQWADDIRELTKLDPKVQVAADISDPLTKFNALTDIAMSYVNSNPTAKALFDDMDAKGKIEYLTSLIGDGSLWVAYSQLNTSGMNTGIDYVKTQLLQFAQLNPTAKAYLDTHNPTENAAYLGTLAMQWAATSPEAEALLNKYGPQMDFATLQAWASAWAAAHPTATADVKTSGTGAAEAELNHVARDRTARINAIVNSGASPGIVNAERQNGGRWGAITAYAKGGVTPAHITRGQLFKYGEPETGGEAFIPRKGRQHRSVNILSKAASWYGMRVVPNKLTPMMQGGHLVHKQSDWDYRDGTWYDRFGNTKGYSKSEDSPIYKEQPEESNYKKFTEAINNELKARQDNWYEKLPQLNKDIFDATTARRNSHVRPVKPKAVSLFGWADKLGPSGVRPTMGSQSARFGGGGTHITVQVMAPVYGVDNLKQAINDGVVEAVGDNYNGVVTKMGRREDARK